MKQAIPSEYEEQCRLINWCNAHQDKRLRLIYAHTNGARVNQGTAVKLKRSGAKAGIPDLFLPVACGEWHGLYIELKRINGKVSPIQQRWIGLLIEQGYCAVVCRGAEDAKRAIEEYFGSQP